MPDVAERRELWWALPSVFAGEVALWEIGSRIGLAEALAEPEFDALGRSIGIDSLTLALVAAVPVLVVFVAATGLRRKAPRLATSVVQLPGVLALAAYWLGAPVWSTGLAVAASTAAAVFIGRRSRIT